MHLVNSRDLVSCVVCELVVPKLAMLLHNKQHLFVETILLNLQKDIATVCLISHRHETALS